MHKKSAGLFVDPVLNQIHVRSFGDARGGSISTGFISRVVTHGDGTLVSPSAPAKAGEELVLHVLGLGPTIPPAKTGEPTPTPPPVAQGPPTLAFDYRPNASPSRGVPEPLAQPPPGARLLFAGLSPGSVGLYQVNFLVPPPPPGTPPCSGGVVSNLTVSVQGGRSFDGAGICVQVDAPVPGL